MPPVKRRRSQGTSAVPLLPPEIADDDIDISDEDLEYFRKHKSYAGFLANLDTKDITRQVLGLKEGQDDDLESYYEKGARRSETSIQQPSVDPADVLPIKTLEGKLHYRSMSTSDPVGGTSISLDERRAIVSKTMNEHTSEQEAPSGVLDSGLEEGEKKKTKAERRQEAKLLKKKKKEEARKNQGLDEQQTLPSFSGQELEVEEDQFSAQRESKLKSRMAEIGIGLLADPEGNIMTLKELQDFCVEHDESISQFAMLSSMAIFKDLIPGYRIRLPTEKEMEMTVSKEVRKLRDYETALLRFYQAFVQTLVRCARLRNLRRTALRCLCGLLEAVPHFNYRESILSTVVPRMNSDDNYLSNLSCQAVITLFRNPGKHGGEATVEAVQLIADLVRLRNCHCRPEVIEVFLDLPFDSELLRDLSSGAVGRSSKEGDQKNTSKLSKRQERKEKKAKKRELAAELRKGVEADFKEGSAIPEVVERRKLQTSTLSAVFETYFRILKRSIEPLPERATALHEEQEDLGKEQLGPTLLLRPCLDGLAKFSHLINVNFMSDLLGALRALASGGKSSSESTGRSVNVWERLQCCTVAFKIVRLNMDALNIDLREFYVLFYNLLLETISIREGEKKGGETLAQALQTMLWESSHSDMSRVTAFVKRLSSLALHLRSGEAMAVLATVQHMVVRYKKCRNILENNGALGSSVLMFQSEDDPDLHEAGSTLLWELSLLAQHYNPEVSKYALTLSSMNKSSSVVMPTVTPMTAVEEFSSLLGSLKLPPKVKRKKQIRPDKQPKSAFLTSLEKRFHSKEEIKETRKLFNSHFRLMKASKKQCNAHQELPSAR